MRSKAVSECLVAFDEPNLYVLYGQQGEASLFGVRGFVVLVNGGFRSDLSFLVQSQDLRTITNIRISFFLAESRPIGIYSVASKVSTPAF